MSWAGKILRVNLTTGTCKSEALNMQWAREYIGQRGLATAMEFWLRHLLDVQVVIEPVRQIEDQSWTWFVGLDSEATRIGNALWHGDPFEQEVLERVLALFRLTFADPGETVAEVGAAPIWLILAMTADSTLRMKPQNLIAGLPLRLAAPAS